MEPQAQVELPPSADSVRTARRFLRETLASWDAEPLEWTASQAVSELVTNAVLHAGTPITVTLTLPGDGRLRVEVGDGSPRVPQQRRYGQRATTGRGIALVAGLAEAWGVETRPGGKTVWCELAVGPADDPDLAAFLTDDELAALVVEEQTA
jgi:anti-sigma regulatory factor (Ser/Thr protein kinase)